MRLFAIALLIFGLAGCATQTDSSDNNPQKAMARAKIHTELAAAYYERTQYKIALEELENALRADSRYAPAYTLRGLVHMVLREDREAEDDFQRSLSLDAENSDTQNNYGWFLCQRGHERESLQHFLIAAKDPLYSTPEKAYLNAGLCSKKAGQIKDAEVFLQRALILQPGMPEALAGLAEVSFVNGDYAGARAYFSRYEKSAAIALTADNLLLVIRIEHKLGNKKAEANYAQKLRNNFPDSREAQLMMQIR